MADFRGKNNPRYRTGLRMGKSSLYNSWCNMKARCLNPKHPKYHRYGGRGITVCEEWLDIVAFVEWAKKNGYQEGLTIDRIDNDKGYCPSNCQWISVTENSRKKSTTKISMEDAEKIRERMDESWVNIAEEYNCTHGTIWFIMNGYTHLKEEGACTKKIKQQKTGV